MISKRNIIKTRGCLICSQISGQYKVQVPLIYDLEKKFGICRHMIVLSPSDSLILQALIQAFAKELVSKAPSEHAYYSRDKSASLIYHKNIITMSKSLDGITTPPKWEGKTLGFVED